MAHESAILKNAANDYETVAAQMAALRTDLTQLAQSVQSIATSRGQAMAKDMSEGMSEAVHYVGRKGHEADLRLEGAVAANPYAALAIAAGLGVLVGAMTRR